MQLLMAALFGILGVLFADPILATLKVVLVDLSRQQEAKEGEGAGSRRPATTLLLRPLHLLRLLLSICWRISAAPPRTIFRTRTSKLSLLPLGKPGGARAVAEGEALRHREAVLAAFLHAGHRLGEAGEDLRPSRRAARRRGSSLLSMTVPSSAVRI